MLDLSATAWKSPEQLNLSPGQSLNVSAIVPGMPAFPMTFLLLCRTSKKLLLSVIEGNMPKMHISIYVSESYLKSYTSSDICSVYIKCYLQQ